MAGLIENITNSAKLSLALSAARSLQRVLYFVVILVSLHAVKDFQMAEVENFRIYKKKYPYAANFEYSSSIKFY